MSVSFARPSTSDLVFHLYGRSVHPELFDVYAEREIERKAWRASLRICDAGHTVGFRCRDTTVAEVATTRRHPLPQRKRLLEKRLRGHSDEARSFECGVNYQVSYQLERLDPEVYVNIHEELMADCSRACVARVFPSENRFSPEPVSLICTEVTARSLLVHAFHTFPEECAVVKTQSLFEL